MPSDILLTVKCTRDAARLAADAQNQRRLAPAKYVEELSSLGPSGWLSTGHRRLHSARYRLLLRTLSRLRSELLKALHPLYNSVQMMIQMMMFQIIVMMQAW